MRISTGMIYDNGVRSIQNQTSSLLHTQEQVSSGRRILTPAEDPVASARALVVNQAKEINAQFGLTQDNAKSTLGLVDSQLSSAGDLLTRVQELAVQSGNAALSANDRRYISAELRARFDELVGLANSTDGSGQYLFSGYQGTNKPFAGSVESGVVYQGDDGQRGLRVSTSRNIPVSDSGNKIFMNVKNGNGIFVTGAQTLRSANAASITVDNTVVTNPTANTGNLEMRFWVDTAGVGALGVPGQTYYDLVDPATGNSIFTPGNASITGAGGSYTNAYTSGTPISISDGAALDYSATLAVTGSPSTGDVISLTRSATAMTTSVKSVIGGAARAVIDAGTVSDSVKWSSGTGNRDLELRFWVDTAGTNTTYYDLVDAKSGVSEFTGLQSATGVGGSYTHSYASGNPISLSSVGPPAFDYGATVTVSGQQPATGDTFTIKSSNDPAGNGYFVTSPKLVSAANTGNGIIGSGEVLDATKWNSPANSGKLEVRFWKDTTTTPSTLYYDLVDAKTEKSLFTDTKSTSGGTSSTYTHKFSAGDTIQFSGLASAYVDFGASVTISGTPGSGDVFSLGNSTSESMFSTLGRLINALEAPAGTGSNGNTSLSNTVGVVLTNLAQASDNLLAVRADVGSRLNEIDSLSSVVKDLNIQYSSTLSTLLDVDYSQAVTDLTKEQVQLQAAQKSFVDISKLSLFNYV